MTTAPVPAPAPLFNWLTTRGAGVLLHPVCLPGDFGIGTFDEHLDRFLEFLEAAGHTHWQLCPLGPTGYGDTAAYEAMEQAEAEWDALDTLG